MVPKALDDLVTALDRTQWAIELTDPHWRLVWASHEMLAVLGAGSDEELGVGEHLLESRQRPAFAARVADASKEAFVRVLVPFMLHDQGLDAVLAAAAPEYREAVPDLEPEPAPPRWSFHLDIAELGRIHVIGERVVDADGRLLGNLFVYGPGLPASLLTFLARGNTAMFERSAQLVAPGRRAAAVLFADLEGSTALSRRLPTARFFEVIRDLMTGMDDAAIRHGGVVGKHGGDGATAFFLGEQIGSPSGAARAAVAAGRDVLALGRSLGVEINVGVHYSATLYLGQVTTGGRLEVTALGDEVNECARIQESATGGVLLAAKSLLERLDDGDAAALGLDVGALEYRVVADLPGAGEKAVRDAGMLPVADVGDATLRN